MRLGPSYQKILTTVFRTRPCKILCHLDQAVVVRAEVDEDRHVAGEADVDRHVAAVVDSLEGVEDVEDEDVASLVAASPVVLVVVGFLSNHGEILLFMLSVQTVVTVTTPDTIITLVS